MIIQVALKTPGNLTKRVTTQPFYLSRPPVTFGEFIEESVRTSVEVHLLRDERRSSPTPLSDEQMAGMAEVGKFAWCLPVDTKPISYEEALRVAREAIADGLVRVFQNNRELTDLNECMAITEGDVFTFVRFTMLTGRMW